MTIFNFLPFDFNYIFSEAQQHFAVVIHFMLFNKKLQSDMHEISLFKKVLQIHGIMVGHKHKRKTF